jgi:DNA-binding Lrp family transcriptional regulator
MVIPFYMLLRTKIGQSTAVVHQIQKIEGVKVVHSVMGNYDIILYAEGKNLEDIRRIRETVHGIKEVTITETAVHA